MSSKHDADNRSNQLNPNNDAYHSSRSGNSDRDDDDEEGGSASSTGSWNAVSEHFRVMYGTPKAIDKSPLRQGFTFDFVSLCGKVALLEMTAEVDQGFFSQGDCIAVAEHVFNKLRLAFLKECGPVIAFSQLKSDDGQIINWVGEEFNPEAFYHSKKSALYLENRKLWEQTGNLAVQKLKGQLTDGSHKPRENLGLINSKQLSGYRG